MPLLDVLIFYISWIVNLAAVIFYSLIYFFSTFFLWVSGVFRNRLISYSFIILSFLLVFVPSAIRFDIGSDYLTYLKIYEDPFLYEGFEISFYLIVHFLKFLGADSQWFFAVMAFIFTIISFAAYPKEKVWIFHIIFFSTLWFFSFNGIRQAVALAWCLLALVNFIEFKYLRFLVFSLIASTFHQSAVLFLLVGIVSKIPIGDVLKKEIIPYLLVCVLVFTYFFSGVLIVGIENALVCLGFEKYGGYFLGSKHFIQREYGSGFGIFFKVLFSIYVILNTSRFLKYNKNCWILILCVFLYAIGNILTNDALIFSRMADIFVIAPILSSYFLASIGGRTLVHKLVLFLYIVFLIMSFLKGSIGEVTSYGDPKINPYQTIFD